MCFGSATRSNTDTLLPIAMLLPRSIVVSQRVLSSTASAFCLLTITYLRGVLFGNDTAVSKLAGTVVPLCRNRRDAVLILCDTPRLGLDVVVVEQRFRWSAHAGEADVNRLKREYFR